MRIFYKNDLRIFTAEKPYMKKLTIFQDKNYVIFHNIKQLNGTYVNRALYNFINYNFGYPSLPGARVDQLNFNILNKVKRTFTSFKWFHQSKLNKTRTTGSRVQIEYTVKRLKDKQRLLIFIQGESKKRLNSKILHIIKQFFCSSHF